MSEVKDRWFAPDSWDREHELRLKAERILDRVEEWAALNNESTVKRILDGELGDVYGDGTATVAIENGDGHPDSFLGRYQAVIRERDELKNELRRKAEYIRVLEDDAEDRIAIIDFYEKTISVPHHTTCPECGGSGNQLPSSPASCSTCGGEGEVLSGEEIERDQDWIVALEAENRELKHRWEAQAEYVIAQEYEIKQYEWLLEYAKTRTSELKQEVFEAKESLNAQIRMRESHQRWTKKYMNERDRIREHADALAKAADLVWLVLLKIAHGDCPICGACFDCDCEKDCPGDSLVTALAAYRKEFGE